MLEALATIVSNATSFAPPKMPWTATEQDIDIKYQDFLLSPLFSANNLCHFVAGDENLERYQVEALELEICKHMSHLEDNTWSCIHCQYTSGSKAPMMAHIESKHMMSSGIICSVCDKICKTRNALNIHKTRYHKSKWK